MNEEVKKTAPAAAPTMQNASKKTARRFIKAGDDIRQVLQYDQDGDELIFESDKGKFLLLTEADVAKLSRDNKVRYHVSRELNSKSDPENDALQQRIKIGATNERRKQFESIVHRTDQSMSSTRKLQAFVGEGYEERWTRWDKVEDRLAQGYEIVKPSEDVATGVAAVDGHFETRVKQGETELVLMRVSKERKAEIMKQKADLAARQTAIADRKGESDLKALGASVISDDTKAPWVDR